MGFTIPHFHSGRHSPPDQLQAPQKASERPLAASSYPLTVMERRAICGALSFSILVGDANGRSTLIHRQLQERLLPADGEL